VDYKLSEAMTYRDRINNALAFWFGDSFSPGWVKSSVFSV